MKRPTLSLVLPCYNEGEHFTKSIELILTALKKSRLSFEIIFVEDKSVDDTPELIHQFVRRYPDENLTVVWHKKNYGRGKTVADGIARAQGKYVGFIDIDCEILPRYISQGLTLIKESGFDFVCGQRRYEISFSGLIRAFASKIYSSLVRLVLGVDFPDTESGYKFFVREKIVSVLSKVHDTGWFWDTEIVMRSHLSGLKIGFLPVEFHRRVDKTSTVNLWFDSIDYFKKLIRFRQQLIREGYLKKASFNSIIHLYWQNNSVAFTGQYSTILGLPLTPVGWFLKIRHQKITRWLKNLPGKTVLSVGCGPGMEVNDAVKLGRFAIGLDYSPQMLALSRKNLSQFSDSTYKLILGNAVSMPLAPHSIDILLASGLTDYLTRREVEQFMREVGRVLKTKGYAIITFPKAASPLKFLRSGWGLWLRQKFLRLPPMESAYTETELMQLFRLAQLHPEVWDEVFSTMWLVRAQKL